MASRRAQLLAVGNPTLGQSGSVLFETGGRRYQLPLPTSVKPRNRNARERTITRVDSLRECAFFQDGGRATLLASLAADYDLTAFLEAGEALPNPPPERTVVECEDAGPVTADEVSAVINGPARIVVVNIAGLPLEVVKNEWVTLRSMYEPFGKRVDKQIEGLKGWANVAKFWLTPRGCADKRAENLPAIETWCVHRAHAAQAIADLSTVGMTEEIRTAFVKYKRECASALDAYFTTGKAENPRLPAPSDPWTILRAVADGTLQLQADVKAANEQSKAAHARAEQAVDMAQRAITLAGSKSVLDAIAEATPPGASSDTPDGAWSAKPPEGYYSMRSVARKYALPSDGAGSGFVGRVARAIGVYDDADVTSAQAVVIGGRTRRAHITYGPKALEKLEKPLRLAHARMSSCGYHVLHGVMQARGGGVVRSKSFVLQEMLAAAAAGASGVRAVASPQATLPGVEQQAS